MPIGVQIPIFTNGPRWGLNISFRQTRLRFLGVRVAALLVENFVYSCALFTSALGDSQGELSALYDLKYREKNSLNKATKG